MNKITMIYTDQIDKLTQKLMEYKRRIRNFEKEKNEPKESVIQDSQLSEDYQ